MDYQALKFFLHTKNIIYCIRPSVIVNRDFVIVIYEVIRYMIVVG